jgi:hypothetical protein
MKLSQADQEVWDRLQRKRNASLERARKREEQTAESVRPRPEGQGHVDGVNNLAVLDHSTSAPSATEDLRSTSSGDVEATKTSNEICREAATGISASRLFVLLIANTHADSPYNIILPLRLIDPQRPQQDLHAQSRP